MTFSLPKILFSENDEDLYGLFINSNDWELIGSLKAPLCEEGKRKTERRQKRNEQNLQFVPEAKAKKKKKIAVRHPFQ